MPINVDMVDIKSGQHVYVESGVHVVGDFATEVSVSGQPVTISGDHVYIESGVYLASGIHVVTAAGSGQHVMISGQHVYIESGAHVVTGATITVSGTFTVGSGLFVDGISGVHVYVESGVQVAGGVTVSGVLGVSGSVSILSGLVAVTSGEIHIMSGEVTIAGGINVSGSPVTISGDHVYVESGAFVTTQPDIGISGTVTVESGVYVASGIFVVATVSVASGLGVLISGQPVTISGQPVVVGSGLNVVGDFDVASGLHVVQSKTVQLQDYFISDIDESDTGIKFYGYLDADSNWYIMQDTSGTNFRYASSGNYDSNWIDRSGIIYQRFDQEF